MHCLRMCDYPQKNLGSGVTTYIWKWFTQLLCIHLFHGCFQRSFASQKAISKYVMPKASFPSYVMHSLQLLQIESELQFSMGVCLYWVGRTVALYPSNSSKKCSLVSTVCARAVVTVHSVKLFGSHNLRSSTSLNVFCQSRGSSGLNVIHVANVMPILANSSWITSRGSLQYSADIAICCWLPFKGPVYYVWLAAKWYPSVPPLSSARWDCRTIGLPG